MIEYNGCIIEVYEVENNVKEHRYRATTILPCGEHPVKYGETKNDAISHIKQYIDMSIRYNNNI